MRLSEGAIYYCRGERGNSVYNTIEKKETNQWTMIAAMGKGRSGIGVIAYAGYVFAVGGYDETTHLRTVEAYNPDTDSWSVMASMVQCRSKFGIAVINDRLFVVGGCPPLLASRATILKLTTGLLSLT
ncbi:Kelch-like protein 10 [Channa argus]|uniref:Kelch-like protein 10 n=1 Tax=Channa argus TaxID=215402 RepID=A0A6G1PQJ0_CHAAH|nr:Kelch-like protein 10 [Channa argus]